MSAFVVDQVTVNRVLGIIAEDSSATREFFRLLPKAILKHELESQDDYWSRLGGIIHDLNRDAVVERYGSKGKFPRYEERFAPYTNGNPWSSFKAIRCLLYQCSEGSVTSRPLFLALDRLADSYGAGLAESTREYNGSEGWR